MRIPAPLQCSSTSDGPRPLPPVYRYAHRVRKTNRRGAAGASDEPRFGDRFDEAYAEGEGEGAEGNGAGVGDGDGDGEGEGGEGGSEGEGDGAASAGWSGGGERTGRKAAWKAKEDKLLRYW